MNRLSRVLFIDDGCTTKRTSSDKPNLDSDSELITAVQAAFGDEGMKSFAEQFSAQSVDTLDRSMELPMQVSGSSQNSDRGKSKIGEDARYLVFLAAGMIAAFPNSCVMEIAGLPDYTELPLTPSWCLGIANISGRMVSVTDLAALAQAPAESEPVDRKVIVVRGKETGASTAVVVDQVIGVQRFRKRVSHSPGDLNVPLAPMAEQIAITGHEQVLLINPDRLFMHADSQSLNRS